VVKRDKTRQKRDQTRLNEIKKETKRDQTRSRHLKTLLIIHVILLSHNLKMASSKPQHFAVFS